MDLSLFSLVSLIKGFCFLLLYQEYRDQQFQSFHKYMIVESSSAFAHLAPQLSNEELKITNFQL